MVGPFGRRESVLDETERAVLRMLEMTYAAFAFQHALFVPGGAEQRAVLTKPFHQCARARIGEAVAIVSTKFRQKTPGPHVPTGDEFARGGIEKNEEKQIAFAARCQPAL